jgi:hypothetical protein
MEVQINYLIYVYLINLVIKIKINYYQLLYLIIKIIFEIMILNYYNDIILKLIKIKIYHIIYIYDLYLLYIEQLY